MEILLWLVPAAVVTVAAMLWVAWLGREERGEVDQEAALQRLGDALATPTRQAYAAPRRSDRSTGIAVRPGTQPGRDQRRAS